MIATNGPLPDILRVIGTATPLHRVTKYELAGPCPWCGGTDRFRVNTNTNRWWCRRCNTTEHWSDGYEFVQRQSNVTFPEAKARLDGTTLPPPPRIYPPPVGKGKDRGPIIATYDYTDETGTLLYQVCRHEPKDFSQRRPCAEVAGGWIGNLEKTRRVLYRLPELLAAPERVVWVVEGEKDADTLASLGLLGTTNCGGSTNWRPEYTEALRGRKVIIVPDQDDAGAKHATLLVAAFKGVAHSCLVVNLPAKDVSAWIESGGTRAQLETLVRDARKPIPIFPGELGADELDELEFEPVREIVKNTIYEGAMLFAGAPKSGKSITMLSIAAACAMGGVALGKIRVERIRVLYFSLEEPKRLTQKRLRLMLGRGRLPALLRLNYVAPPLPQLIIDIERYVEQFPDTALVVIDTLAHARGPAARLRKDIQQEDYQELVPFSHLAQRLHIAIVILSHTNKSEHDQVVGRVAGSYGLSGAVDGILLLERNPKSSEAKLNVLNRELGSDVEHDMHWDHITMCYTVEGPVQEGAPKSDTWQRIIRSLAGGNDMSISEIVAETGLPESTIKPQVARMVTAGDIEHPARGIYSAKNTRYFRNDRYFTPENDDSKVAKVAREAEYVRDPAYDQSSESSDEPPLDIVNYQGKDSKVAKVAPFSTDYDPADPDSF